ncbi:MFS transporter [Metabacillus niabensis]|uniref:MFS family permease n=1 Tax=Metabacillus niabensis TaxID=324854 RepID=A0ABT9Z222_9BACI|nr:MFS transporter [Metabacillus niabensis]MDQ0226298.1 MFS family permease [Metabacillus niabensis]
MYDNEKIWTKDFIIIGIINFLSILMFYLLMVTIASYAMDEYHVSTSTAGLVSSIFIVGSLIGRLGAGRFIAQLGATKILWIGLSTFLITSCFYFIQIGVGFLLINRLLQGIGVGIIGTAAGTIIAQILPASKKGEGIGYFSLSVILATAIGPFIGIYLMKLKNGFNLMFSMNIILSAIILIGFFFVKLKLPVVAKQTSKVEGKSILSKFIEPKAVPISIIALIVGFTYSGIMSFLSFYAEEIDLVDAASYFFLAYAIIIIISRPYTGKIMDAKGANIIVYPCLAVFTVGMLLFSEAASGWMLLVSAVLIGFGYGNFNSIAQTVAVKVTEPHRFGLATSTYYILYDLGLGVGPFILGFIAPITGYRTVFLLMVPIILICIPLYYFLYGRKEKAQLSLAETE